MRLATLLLAIGIAPTATAQWSTHAVLDEMAPIIRPCVQPTNGPRAFVRCFDTHSSVHAHWAAFRIARHMPTWNAMAFESDAALEPAKVALEVAQHVNYPYAEAWFLLLALDYELWAEREGLPDPYRLRPSANLVADRMLARYQVTPPDPRTSEYDNSSWHLLQMHRWYERVGDSAARVQIDSWIGQLFLGPIQQPTLRRDVNQPFFFFSIHGNWAHLVLETQDAPVVQQFVADQGPYPNRHIVPNPLNAFVHSYGMGWSRAWALRSMARNASSPADRLRFWRAAEAHITMGMHRHVTLQGNFATYDHWVPQFAVYAVTE
jgi:hypothetical protein